MGELANKIRSKYPGAYDALQDADLEAKVMAKYPGVYDHLAGPKQTTSGNLNASPAEAERMRREFVQKEGTLGTRVKESLRSAVTPAEIPRFIADAGVATVNAGMRGLKSVASTVQGGGEAIRTGNIDAGLQKYAQKQAEFEPVQSPLQPSGIGQAFGEVAGAGVSKLSDLTGRPDIVEPVAQGVMDIGALLGARAVAKPSLRALGKASDAIPRPKGSTLEGVIDTGIDKGIRPGIEGNRTFAQSGQYHKRAQQAVKTIIDNHSQGALKLTDEFGEATGTLPRNLRQFSQAIDQSKRNIYEQYNKMAVESGSAGATVDLSPIPNELMSVANNRALQKAAPGVAEYAKARAKAFSGESTVTDGVSSKRSNTFTTEEAQQAIAIYNQSLEAFNKNPSYDTASRAYIDSLIVNNLRKGLDASIEQLSGPGYQALKNEYGALKTIEKDVSRRAIVDARKNTKGLLDFSDVFSGGQVVNGLLSMNPAVVGSGIASKVIANIYKMKNDPNKIVSKMFDKAGKMYTPKQRVESASTIRPTKPQESNPMAGKVNTGGITQPGPVINSIGPVNTNNLQQSAPQYYDPLVGAYTLRKQR